MRRRIAYALPLAALAVLAVALVTMADSDEGGKGKRARPLAQVPLKNADGKGAGQVRLAERRNGEVAVSVRARGLPAGFHGFHVHEKGLCEPPTFMSAGGHHKEEGQAHGDHAGDMPPLLVGADGNARAAFVTDSFRIKELVAGDGSAIMIHAKRDNLANIPSRYRSGTGSGPDEETSKTGDAGDRLACGVVKTKRR